MKLQKKKFVLIKMLFICYKSRNTQTVATIFRDLDSGTGSFGQTKSIAYEYVSKRQCSLQEAVQHLMLETCLRKVFPGVLYDNSNISENCNRIMLFKKEILELP